MFTEFYCSQSQRHLQVCAGRLALHLDSFANRLAKQGYSRYSTRVKLATVCDFGDWIEHEDREVSTLDEQCVEVFLQTRKARRGRRRAEAATVRQFVDTHIVSA